MTEEILTRVQKLKPLAEELNLTMAQFGIAWVLQNQNVAAAIVGASRPEQIQSNVAAVGVEIPSEIMKKVDEILGDTVFTDTSLTKSPAQRPTGR